jgi:hypothetical protein
MGRITAKKAVAAAGPADDESTDADSSGPTDKAPVQKKAGATKATGATRGTSAAKATGATGGTSAAKATGATVGSSATKTTGTTGGTSAAKATGATVGSSATKTTGTTKATGATTRAGATKVTSAAAKSTTTRAAGGAGSGTAKKAVGRGPGRPGAGRGRAPVRIAEQRNWTQIAIYIGTGVLALAIVGFAAFTLINRADPTKWQSRADAIPGIIDYRKTHPDWIQSRNHINGVLPYPMDPPAGGNHNPIWQNCMGNVYTAAIAKEHAVHSLEHGAVWITYKPGLPADQVATLASKVTAKGSYIFMSPYPGLTSNISLQAWGFQLRVSDANDSRIDDFINNLRVNAAMEPGASCSQGITDTGNGTLNLSTAAPSMS